MLTSYDTPNHATPATLPHDRVAELSHDFRLANGRLTRRLRQQQADNELTAGQFSALCALFVRRPADPQRNSASTNASPRRR